MQFVGMDTDQGRVHAERLQAAAQRLIVEHDLLSSSVQASEGFWTGPDADAFRASWASGGALLLRDACDGVRRHASSLDGEVQEQEAASAAEASGTEPGGPGQAAPGSADALYGGDGGGPSLVSADVARAWNAMSEDEQEQVLREVVQQELQRQGCPDVPVYFNDLDDGYLGVWWGFDLRRPWRGEHIIIDTEHAKSPDALNTAAHEARHAAQMHWVEETAAPPGWQFWREDGSAAEYERIERDYGVTREEIEAWRENDKSYEKGPSGPQPSEDAPAEEHEEWLEEYRKYAERPLEADAAESGGDLAEGITLEELQQYQRDAGVPVTS